MTLIYHQSRMGIKLFTFVYFLVPSRQPVVILLADTATWEVPESTIS